ncbi:MAG TPA: aminoacyl-histidine dipeptidase [Longimicrobiales bacterium]|nr:aminoacyl-histidine dipeptidase [Longimicrobiales bacterium]
MTFVSDFEPRPLWSHFDAILTIPRGSKEEERIRSYVVQVAERLGLEHLVDATGNVVVKKPGTAGKENAAATILQAHLDMVNEKNSDVEFDFSTDAIKPLLEGEYLTADGTTLGSDNGIGVAAMLAIMEATDLVHGPLEFLFTIDEETGLTGAAGLDPTLLSAKRLINLDSEAEGALTVGCAGGADTDLALALETVPPPADATAHTVKLFGLNGGHSGVDIHLQRGNAVQLLARMLHAAAGKTSLFVAEIQGGNKHNAIPREAWATVVIPAGGSRDFVARLEQSFHAVKAEYSVPEPGMEMRIDDAPLPATVWSARGGRQALGFLVAMPHGVIAMSNDIPGLVETSTNLAAVKSSGAEVRVLMSSRSSVASALHWIREKIEAVGDLAGAKTEHHDGYPGWKPDLDSELLKVVQGVHKEVLGSDPHVEAIHAGLECGLIGEMVPGMDMISFGPQIEFPHSPNERVKVDSVKRFYDLLTETLKELA